MSSAIISYLVHCVFTISEVHMNVVYVNERIMTLTFITSFHVIFELKC